jgi:hypothetical protein
MKSIISLIAKIAILLITAFAFGSPAKAQITPFTYFNVDWQFNVPLGNDFANKASGWGMNFEGGYYVAPDFALGAFLAFHTNHEYVPRRTLTLSSTTALTTDQQHSVYQLPFGLATHYRFRDGKCQPYAAVKLGANYARLSSDFNVYEISDKTWGFYLSPELGVNVYPWPGAAGFHLAVYYSYATNGGEVLTSSVSDLNNFGFRVGLAF